jgi:hypothetical protein
LVLVSNPTRPAASLATLLAAEALAADAERAALIAHGPQSPEAHAAWLVSSAAFRATHEALMAEGERQLASLRAVA